MTTYVDQVEFLQLDATPVALGISLSSFNGINVLFQVKTKF